MTQQRIITVIPDKFSGEESKLVKTLRRADVYGDGIRRPTRGITLKKETFASLRVISSVTQSPITLVDAGARGANSVLDGSRNKAKSYTNFLLQQVTEERMEKSQILETFGEPFIFLFGERPRMISFSGVLINTFDFNWEAEWWDNYENYLRGTKCVESDSRVFLSFDNTIVSGYILSASSTKTAMEPNHVSFQFQMFVTSYSNFSDIGNPNAFPGWEFNQIGELSEVTYKDLARGVDTSEALRTFRPSLLNDFGKVDIQSSTIGSNQKMLMPSLEESLKSRLSVVKAQWATVRDAIVTSSNLLSDKLNGGGVRVPVGFAGAMEFDEGRVTLTQPEKQGYGVVRYTTFSDNIDEYVGSSSQYQSSTLRVDWLGVSEENQLLQGEKITYEQKMVDRAMSIWEDSGIHVSEDHLGPAANFMVKRGVGMQLVAAAKASTVPSTVGEIAKGTIVRFANALPNPYGAGKALENKL